MCQEIDSAPGDESIGIKNVVALQRHVRSNLPLSYNAFQSSGYQHAKYHFPIRKNRRLQLVKVEKRKETEILGQTSSTAPLQIRRRGHKNKVSLSEKINFDPDSEK